MGTHIINQISNAYQDGDIFLLGPEDEHYFEIVNSTHFLFVKFTDPYLYKDYSGSTILQQKLEYLIKSRETHLSGFKLHPEDSISAEQIFTVISTLKEDILHNEELIWMQVLSLALILQRNMPELKLIATRSRNIQAMFCYLHKHIYTPEKLKATNLAMHFNTTADYIGPYFKRNAGITLRDYIREYRKVLIEQRTLSGKYSLKEIASQFGLTDESHVAKILK